MDTPPLIALTGRKRSGKDTAAAHLIEHQGYTRIAFADPVKRILADVNPYLDGIRMSASFADTPEAGRLLGAFTAALPRWTPVQPLPIEVLDALDALDPFVAGTVRLKTILDVTGGDWDLLKEGSTLVAPAQVAEIRRLQQRLATESLRAVFGDSLFADVALHWAARDRSSGRSVVITDCRFDVEARAVRDAGGTIVAIERPDLPPPTDGHSSEAGVSPSLIDHVVVNDGTIAELHQHLERFARQGVPA